jgi:hypothetical protein
MTELIDDARGALDIARKMQARAESTADKELAALYFKIAEQYAQLASMLSQMELDRTEADKNEAKGRSSEGNE